MIRQRKLERVKGLAILGTVRRGTGSEHVGVMLDTSDGEPLILVRLGANPFADRETRKLVGSTLEVEGYRVGRELRYVSTRKVG
jgi:hypothetical protein